MPKQIGPLGRVLPDYTRPDLSFIQQVPLSTGHGLAAYGLYTVPGEYVDSLVTLTVQYALDATPGLRVLRLLLDNQDQDLLIGAPTAAPGNPSEIGIITFSSSASASSSSSTGAGFASHLVAWPALPAMPGSRFVLDAAGQSGGDQWVRPIMFVERVPTGPTDDLQIVTGPPAASPIVV